MLFKIKKERSLFKHNSDLKKNLWDIIPEDKRNTIQNKPQLAG